MTGRECDVSPYSDSYESITGVPIVTGATAWTCQQTFETFILVVNEALWMPNQVGSTLVNPNQLRSYGTVVKDNPFEGRIFIEDVDNQLTIPMKVDGTNILFETRTPTQDELDTCRHIQLNSQQEWDPANMHVPKISSIEQVTIEPEQRDDEIYNPDTFSRRLLASVQVRDVPEEENVGQRRIQEVLTDIPTPPTFTTESRRADVSPESLADRWMIGVDQAKLTLKNTTQKFVRCAMLPLSRRYKADRIHMRKTLSGEWYTDTVFGPCKSKDGNTCGQIFANSAYFATFYPMDSKGKAGEALRIFCNEFGVPETLRHDGSKEQCGRSTLFQKQVSKHGIKSHVSEADLHNQSPAEGVVREVRRKWYRTMFKKRAPRKFWDYGLRWCCEVMSRTHLRRHRLDGGVPLQQVTGETVDISPYLEFGFWDRVWYRDNSGLGPALPGRWLGVAPNVGGLMTYWILQANGQVVGRGTVWNPTNLEMQTDVFKATFDEYDKKMWSKIDDKALPMHGDKPDPAQWADLIDTDKDFRDEFFKVYEDEDLKDAEDNVPEPSPGICDTEMLQMQIALPRGGYDEPQLARVKRRKLDADGNAIGVAHKNPILDTRLFEVEFPDGHVASMAANTIAENLFAQVDQEGHRLLLMDEIVDHRRGKDAVVDAIRAGNLSSANGQRRQLPTTKGWELLIRWKDGSETWTPLKDMKEAYTIQTAEYAVQSGLTNEPAFSWWVPYVLKKRKAIVSKVKSKYWQRTHKYGIEIPKSIDDAKKLDDENENTLWWDAICDEMKTVKVAFEVIPDGQIPVGYTKIDCHMIFDVKLGENYRRKARFVAGGHRTKPPASITYSSVVSRDSVRICLTLAALNGLDVLACDIKGAYLTAPCSEKVVTYAGEEFGPELKGKLLRVTKALYGLRSAGAAFRSFLGQHFHGMGYRPSYADPDVWMRPAIKADGSKYYEYLLAYVDDILCISAKPMATMDQIKSKFKLKGDKVAPPDDYLGAVLQKKKNDHGFECWFQSSAKYLDASVKNVEEKLKEKKRKLPGANQSAAPFPHGYRPELDTTGELQLDGHRYFQELIGVLRWAVELGRLDILLEVSMLSAYLASPREGHLEAAIHIFAYIKHHPDRKIAFDPEHPDIDPARFKKYDWEAFYRDAEEAIPPNAPPPLGKPVTTHCFVDASFAGNVVNRRSHMGILLFVNRAPVMWLSKRTNTVETSTFGAEIVALRHAVEMIESLRYKLRMFGVPIEGPTNVFCDNEAVTKNCSIPESTLSKKHHSINYHRNREAVAAGTIRIAYENTKTNLADAFTKILSIVDRTRLFDKFMY